MSSFTIVAGTKAARKAGIDRFRPKRGSVLAEAPVTLWVLFFVLFLPCMNLGAVCLRSTLLYWSVHTAAFEAARAKTFQAAVNGSPSAVQLASSQVQSVVAAFSGITVSQVSVNIVSTDVNTMTVARQSVPLSVPADASQNTYQIEVTAKGTFDPFFNFRSNLFPAIPGLTAPIPATFVDRQFCENPQGLNI
jgi:hypothetical protein